MIESKMLSIDSLYTRSGVCDIEYTSCGDKNSSNVFICVHGLGRNSRDFDYLAEELSHHGLVISPSMPGRGGSSRLNNFDYYSYPVYCSVIIDLCKVLNIKRFHFIGTSMGGIIGMFLGSMVPEMIQTMVINDIGPSMDMQCIRKISDYLHNFFEFDNLRDAKNYFQLCMSEFGIKDDHIWDHILSHGVELNKSGKYLIRLDRGVITSFKKFTDNFKGEKVEFWREWGNICSKIRILLLRGEFSKIFPRSVASRMFESREGLSFVEFPGVGHAPSLMYPDQTGVVKNWILGNASYA